MSKLGSKGKKKNLEHEIGAALPPLQHADTQQITASFTRCISRSCPQADGAAAAPGAVPCPAVRAALQGRTLVVPPLPPKLPPLSGVFLGPGSHS